MKTIADPTPEIIPFSNKSLKTQLGIRYSNPKTILSIMKFKKLVGICPR